MVGKYNDATFSLFLFFLIVTSFLVFTYYSLLENLFLEREEIRHKMMNFRHKYDLRRNL